MRKLRDRITGAHRPARPDLVLAVGLTVVLEVEALLGSSDGWLVRALTVPLMTLPLAWRRQAPLLPVVAVAAVLLIQAAFGDFFGAEPATPLVVIVIAIYSAGRHVAGAKAIAGAVVAVAAVAATRIAFDPTVRDAADAILTALAVMTPFLMGRWVDGQVRLQHEVEDKTARRERDRERAARQAAEEERMRIAFDLEATVADRLGEIVRQARELPARLAAQEHAAAREQLLSIATSAREALADVRRVLGILRHDGQPPRLAPPDPERSAALTIPAVPEPRSEPDPDAAPQPAARSRWSRLHPGEGTARSDRTLVAVLLAGAELELALAGAIGDHTLAVLTPLPIVAPLLARRHWPVPAALAAMAAVALQSALLDLDSFPVADAATLICVSYAIGAYAAQRIAIAGLVLIAAAIAAHAAQFYPDGVLIAPFAAAAVPWTLGRVVRGQRLLTHEVREKAVQTERARAGDERAAVTAERMSVARELHDAVAHNISVIAIQAAGADGIVERDPERAAQCAALIETVGREAIVELSRLAGLPSTAGDRPPASQPGLARVDALARRTSDGGLPVELRVEGEPARLAAGVDLAAFRIVQEALANASKHAGAARAWVVVRYEQRAVELEIADDGRGPNGSRATRAGTGHGLIGMRERVALYGGTLDVGRRPGGGFTVRARIPLGGS